MVLNSQQTQPTHMCCSLASGCILCAAGGFFVCYLLYDAHGGVMHGSSGPTLILNLSPMSEEEMESERLREIARSSHLSMSDHCDPDDEELVTVPMLIESSDDCECRTPDDVLFDHMEPVESQHFGMSRMPDFARAMGASEDEIHQFALQMGADDFGNMREPKSLSKFKSDYNDLQRFGGDPIAVAMSKESEMSGMSGSDMDDMLSVTMDSTSMMDMSDPMNQAMASLEERFGRDAMAVLEGEADGYVLFSVDTPDTGMVKYIYDSRDGVGRVIRG